jgi:DNA-binding transcriptional ArsR family regulator
MQLDHAADCLDVLGSPHRLKIYRLLVQAGNEGLNVGEIQKQLEMAPSTLSHHLSKLVHQGLINQERDSRKLVCNCNYAVMDELITFLSDECCRGERCGGT